MQRKDNPGRTGRSGVATAALVLDLLAFAAARPSAHRAGRRRSWEEIEDRGIDDRALRYVSEAGLAPFLHYAARASIERMPAAQRDVLLSAELTAQVRHGAMTEVASEVVELCRGQRVPVTLLKGISITEQHYPAAHLRPMGDVDLLVSQHDRNRVQSALLERGYIPLQPDWPEASYHAVPLRHPESGVWVEVHDALFPEDASLMANELFTPDQIARQSVAWKFHGSPVRRLSDELQLAYVASYWVRDLSMQSIHPSFIVPLLDAVLLLKNSGERMNWDGMLGWLDNEMAAASLYIMLSYLARHGLATSATDILPRLASRQKLVGATEMSLLDALLDSWLVGGRSPLIGRRASFLWDELLSHRFVPAKLISLSWRVVFPEDVADRYSARHLLRLLHRLANAEARGWR